MELRDGQLVITTSGGVAPYSYTINGGSSQSNGTFAGLGAGVYSVDVTEATGCISTVNETINDPITAVVTSTVTDVLCNGSMDGSITVNVTGGTSPIEYSLDGGTFQTSNEFPQFEWRNIQCRRERGERLYSIRDCNVDQPDPSLPAVGTSSYSTIYGTSFSTGLLHLIQMTMCLGTSTLITSKCKEEDCTLAALVRVTTDLLLPLSNLSSLEFVPESVGTFSLMCKLNCILVLPPLV